MAKKVKATNEKRLLFVKMNDGTSRKVSIPSGCKITFGPMCPGSKDGNYNSSGATALRIYQGPSQLACFVKVEYFYETDSVSAVHKRTKRASKQQAYTKDGIQKNRNVTVEVSEWKNELEEEDDTSAGQAFAALKEGQDNREVF